MKKLLALVASTLALAACTDTTAPDLTPKAEAAKASLDATTDVTLKRANSSDPGRIAVN
jgi:uncharacterized lipoprotein YajG